MQRGRETVIQIDGQLMTEGVVELERLCAAAPRPLTLELAGLSTIDRDGRRALHALADQGIRLVGASPYIELLLKHQRDR